MTNITPSEVERMARTVGQTGHNHFITTAVPAVLRALLAENAALREKLETAGRDWETARDAHDKVLAQLTEARAQAAAAWEAGRKVGAGKGGCGYPCGYDCNGACFTPPADLSEALQKRLDAEWDAGIEATASIADGQPIANSIAERIRALRRNPKEVTDG